MKYDIVKELKAFLVREIDSNKSMLKYHRHLNIDSSIEYKTILSYAEYILSIIKNLEAHNENIRSNKNIDERK